MQIRPEIKEKIVLALDVDTPEQAKQLITELKDYVGIFKVGLQMYTGNGYEIFNFMKEQNVLSNLKLRASIGQTGNAEIGENAFGFYSVGLNAIFGNNVALGVSENQLSNPKLKWETTTEYNLGLDFGFVRNRITGTFEFFQKSFVKRLPGNICPSWVCPDKSTSAPAFSNWANSFGW